FFQAEDGIRDRNVTGVQTCALPISSELPSSEEPSPSEDAASSGSAAQAARGSRSAASAARRGMRETARAEDAEAAGVESVVRDRSEERRVGKEWGSAWAAGGSRAHG